jgi:micrococcal nuclease
VRRSWLPGLLLLIVLAALVAALLVVGARLVVDGRTPGGAGTATDPPAAGPDGVARPASVPDDAEPAVVDRVVDGDTIRILDPAGGGADSSVRVRLLQVDAPELDHPQRGRECGAGTATAMVEDLLPPGSAVWLAADREDRDRFDRLLRYAWSEDGVDVQAALVEAGFAEVLVIAPNDRFVRTLRPLEAAARERAAGVWGEGCPD